MLMYIHSHLHSVHASMTVRGQHLCFSQLLSIEIGSVTELGMTESDGLAAQQALESVSLLPSAKVQSVCHHTLLFNVFWGLDLGPCVSKASTLSTEPSLSSCSLNSF